MTQLTRRDFARNVAVAGVGTALGGLRVLGVSGISNALVTTGSAGAPASHQEVLDAGQRLVPQLIALVRGVLKSLPR